MGRGTGFCKRDSPRSITLGSAAAPTITRVTKKEKSIQYFVTRRVVRIVTSEGSDVTIRKGLAACMVGVWLVARIREFAPCNHACVVVSDLGFHLLGRATA